MEALIKQIGLPLIAALVPLVVALIKKAVPSIPSWLIPILALILGPLGEAAASAITGIATTGWQGALAGLAGVGIREIVDQAKKAITEA